MLNQSKPFLGKDTFILYFAQLALPLDKVGCISTIKIKVFGLLFCFVFDLDKNLTLKKDNLFSFSSLNRFFALSLFPNCGHITPATVRKTWVHI